MKRAVVLGVLLVFALGSVSAEESTFQAPWAAPVPDVEEGARLIAVGFWGDVIGIGLIAGASPAYTISFGAGQTLFELGLVSMLFVGNPCFQKGMTQHHDALVEQGYDVDADELRRKSTLFSRIALGCGVGSVALGVGAAVTDSLGLAIGSIVVGGAGSVFEIINFYKFRLGWGQEMKAAAGIAVP